MDPHIRHIHTLTPGTLAPQLAPPHQTDEACFYQPTLSPHQALDAHCPEDELPSSEAKFFPDNLGNALLMQF